MAPRKKAESGLVAIVVLVATLAGCGGAGGAGTDRSPGDGNGARNAPRLSRPPLPAGKYLYLAGPHHLTIVDVDAAASWAARRPRLWPGDPRFPVLRRGQRLVYYGPGGTDSIDLSLLGPPRRLDPARGGGFGYFFPSTSDNRVWIGLRDPARPGRGDLGALRELTAAGKVTRQVPAPRGSWPAVAVRDGLAFSTPHSTQISVWDPRTGDARTIGHRGFATAGHGDLLVSGNRSYASPVLHVTDVGSGADRTLRPPDGLRNFDVAHATFSPNGRLLAVPVTTRAETVGPRWLAIIHPHGGSMRLIAGSKVLGAGGFVTWASDGSSVFMSGNGYESGNGHGPHIPARIVVYRPGNRRAHRIPLELPDFFGMAAS